MQRAQQVGVGVIEGVVGEGLGRARRIGSWIGADPIDPAGVERHGRAAVGVLVLGIGPAAWRGDQQVALLDLLVAVIVGVAAPHHLQRRDRGALALVDDRLDRLLSGGHVGDHHRLRHQVGPHLVARGRDEDPLPRRRDGVGDGGVELADRDLLGHGRRLEVQRVLGLLDLQEGPQLQHRERRQVHGQVALHPARQRAGIGGDEGGGVDHRRTADGVEHIGRQGHVQHLLDHHRGKDRRDLGIEIGVQRIQRVEIWRDRRVLQLDRRLQGGEQGRGAGGRALQPLDH